MESKSCVMPGSYDPVTLGHIDIIQRAAKVFDVVYAALLDNTSKQYMFGASERMAMLEAAVNEFPNVRVCRWEGLLTGLLASLNVRTVVRGLRDGHDFAAERQLAAANAMLLPGTETLWLGSSPRCMGISSTVVRELIRFGADISDFVPCAVAKFLHARNDGG